MRGLGNGNLGVIFLADDFCCLFLAYFRRIYYKVMQLSKILYCICINIL